MTRHPMRSDPRAQRLAGWGLALILLLMLVDVVLTRVSLPVIGLVVYAVDLLNFIFHEAGHPIFAVLGPFMGALGGTIGQLCFPFVALLVAVFLRRSRLSAAIFVFWMGQSVTNIGVYMADARARELQLFGPSSFGGIEPTHDWQYIFGELGLLPLDTLIGGATYAVGVFMMVLAVLILIIPASVWWAWLAGPPADSQPVH